MPPFRVAAAALTVLVAAVALPGCARDCEEIGAEIDSLLAEWQTCSEGDTCVLLQPPTATDCTGKLSCGFAVRTEVEDEAATEAARLVDEASSGCEACAVAQCPTPVDAYCAIDPETLQGKCTVTR
jgi:hypothetical protein